MAKGMISAAVETVQRWIGMGPSKKTVKPGQKTRVEPSKMATKGGKVVKARR